MAGGHAKHAAGEGEHKERFRGADLILNRIRHDPSLEPFLNDFVVGYLDRFLGVVELPVTEFKNVHDDRDGVPLHRIRHFKLRGVRVWDRDRRLDLLTHSTDLAGEVQWRVDAAEAMASPPRARPPRRGGRHEEKEEGAPAQPPAPGVRGEGEAEERDPGWAREEEEEDGRPRPQRAPAPGAWRAGPGGRRGGAEEPPQGAVVAEPPPEPAAAAGAAGAGRKAARRAARRAEAEAAVLEGRRLAPPSDGSDEP
eukprot:tig00020830_g14461.t1